MPKGSNISRSNVPAPRDKLTHPGQYVRDVVLTPKKMSVTTAAKVVGVGRPALSSFLNGHVATSPDMASRIEHAFGISARDLLDMQAAYDAARTKAKGTPAKAKPYVPPFLDFKANDIEAWASQNIGARVRLSVLLRTLVNSTGVELTKVDFPGNDDAQRPGWDGFVIASEATQWIPEGASGWEFGTNVDVKGKADGDFAKSVNATDKAERRETTFVFVTPRRWPGKNDWTKNKQAEGLWKDVRAYDASDLEQWFEQSIAAQTWFANETVRPSNGVRTLDKCWTDWADIADPPLVASLFEPAVEGAKRTMTSRLSKEPSDPTIVAADSTDEALAFLAQIFSESGGEELAAYRDRVLVFDQPGVLPKLAQGSKNFIAVATSRDVERELGTLSRSMHTIVVYPRNATNADPHVTLEPLHYEAFRKSLEAMGYERDDITRLGNESGHSLTVLRRRLSNVQAIRVPAWAADHETAMRLVPFLLTGAWDSAKEADQIAVALVGNTKSYETLEKEFRRLMTLNDVPLWSIGSYRGVVSKIDLLFAIANSVTLQDLKLYFDLARLVLGEDDPKLDLPESERWAAALHGKSREFSAALRRGISETLVLLAVHGNHLFRARLGFDCEIEINRLVRELLTPLKARILEANDNDLPLYAEAAPDQFLSILEDDLGSDHPQCYELMRPADASIFGGGCARTGLLWALEGLAWNPQTLTRAALILAQLAQIEINDNWANKPIGSLEAIFRSWMPQTAADFDERMAVIGLIKDKYPKVAWKICTDQFGPHLGIGDYSHKPSWRPDAHGYGEPVPTWGPILAFKRNMIDMALGWNGHTPEMLCDLIERLYDLSDEDQAKTWELVRSWAEDGATDADKAIVREKIRVTVMSRRGVRHSKKKDQPNLTSSAKAAYKALEPSDLLHKHEWLFRQTWVEELANELNDDDLDLDGRESRIEALRAEALREVLTERGIAGVIELAEMGGAASQIGWLMVTNVLQEDEIPAFLLEAFPRETNSEALARKNIVFGGLHSIRDQVKRAKVLHELKEQLQQEDMTRLLMLAPFCRQTWQMVDGLDEIHRQTYWGEVTPDQIRESDEENNESIERLISAKRPRAAFASVKYMLPLIRPDLLFKLMSKVLKDGKDKPGHYQLDQYYVEQAFKLMNKNPELTLEQKAGLEFDYIEALSQPWRRGEAYGIPNLEKYVEAHPELFVQAVVWTYKRDDDGTDPEEWQVPAEQVEHFAKRGYKLLEGLNVIPGHDDLGDLKAERLSKWIKTVREACDELGRLKVCDISLGRLMSCAPEGEDGVWPCEPVRDVMEEVRSREMMEGAHTGLYNSRGVKLGEGGSQERALADKYRAWANALQYSHPFLAANLLMSMVKTYEYEATREDDEASIRRRLL